VNISSQTHRISQKKQACEKFPRLLPLFRCTRLIRYKAKFLTPVGDITELQHIDSCMNILISTCDYIFILYTPFLNHIASE
jgi:hypothetical protein